MNESLTPKLDGDDVGALAEAKLPLVLRDYQSFFEVTSRHYERITHIRQWEVALISALAVVLLTRQAFPMAAILPLYLVIAVFAVMESGGRASLTIIATGVREVESELEVKNVDEFRANIANWTFGNHRFDEIASRRSYHGLMKKALLSPGPLLWHGGLVLAVTVLLVLNL